MLADALTLADEDKPDADRRFRDADRRGARRARSRRAAVLHRRRCARRGADALAPRPRTIRCGGCRCGGLTKPCSIPRSPTSTMSAPAARPAPSPRRCSCAASSTREILAASRHLRLDADGQARPAGRRRMPGGARALRAACRALRLIDMVALDPRITPARADLAAKHLEGKVAAARFVEGARLRGDRAAGAAARASRAPDAPLDTEALKGERVTVYESNDEGWAWGQLAARRLCRLAAGQCAGAAGPRADAQGRGAADVRFSRAVDQAAAASKRCRSARRLAVAQRGAHCAVTRNGRLRAGCASGAARRRRDRFRRRGGAISRYALSVGRQDARSGSTARAWCRWRCAAAGIAARATATCRKQALGSVARPTRRICSAAT